MDGTEFALCRADCRAQFGKTLRRNAAILEGSIQRRLTRDQFSPTAMASTFIAS